MPSFSKYFGRSRSPPRADPSIPFRSQRAVSSNTPPERPRSRNNELPRPQIERRAVSDNSSRSLHISLSSSSHQTPRTNHTSSGPSWTTDSLPQTHPTTDSLPLRNPTTDSSTRTAHINVTTSHPPRSDDRFARLYEMGQTLPNTAHISVSSPGPSRNLPDHQKPASPPHRVTPQELRKLRELIQERYQLDIRLWGARKARPYVRDRIKDFMRQSDAKLAEIQKLVLEWDNRECFETDQQYHKFRTIALRIFEPGKRKWMEEPPWLDAHVD